MLGDPIALAKMLSGFAAPCTPAPKKTIGASTGGDVGESPKAEDEDAKGAFESAVVDEHMNATGDRQSSPVVFDGGCSMTQKAPVSAAGGFFGLGLAMMAWARRRVSRSRST